jgi:hypothetical protein
MENPWSLWSSRALEAVSLEGSKRIFSILLLSLQVSLTGPLSRVGGRKTEGRGGEQSVTLGENSSLAAWPCRLGSIAVSAKTRSTSSLPDDLFSFANTNLEGNGPPCRVHPSRPPSNLAPSASKQNGGAEGVEKCLPSPKGQAEPR